MTKENKQIIKYSSNNPNPIDKHVGNILKNRMKFKGFSQEKLGDALGITFQQVQKYCNATNRISASKLYEISKILDVDVNYFFNTIDDEDMATSYIDEDIAKLAGKIDNLPQELKEQSIAMFNQVINTLNSSNKK